MEQACTKGWGAPKSPSILEQDHRNNWEPTRHRKGRTVAQLKDPPLRAEQNMGSIRATPRDFKGVGLGCAISFLLPVSLIK